MNRRRFGTLLAFGGAGMGVHLLASEVNPQVLQLKQNGWMPNNEKLPVLLYGGVFAGIRGDPSLHSDPAAHMEAVFAKNGWPAQWRNGVYDFHHYHSTAHEVLGFAKGWGRLILGGEGGHTVLVNAGDVAVLPAGTGHCRLEASSDFLVVGAYPAGETWDICRSAPTETTLTQMRAVPFPDSDPVTGPRGPLVRHWSRG